MQLYCGESGRSDARAAVPNATAAFLVVRIVKASRGAALRTMVAFKLVCSSGSFAFLLLLRSQQREQNHIANRS